MSASCGLWQSSHDSLFDTPVNVAVADPPVTAFPPGTVFVTSIRWVPPTPTPEPVSLTINGAVNTELQLTDSALHAMNVVTINLTHPKSGAADYTGVRLSDLLAQAGVKDGAATVTFTASDGFTYETDLATVQACTDCLVAFTDTPGVYNFAFAGQTSGKAWTKNLASITVVAPEPVTLTISGLVDNELKLTDSALHGMTVVTLNLAHPKKGAMDYTGVRLSDILIQAVIKADAKTVTFTASDGFAYDADLATVQACTDCLVAFTDTSGVYNLAFAGQTSGKAWVSSLVSITVK